MLPPVCTYVHNPRWVVLCCVVFAWVMEQSQQPRCGCPVPLQVTFLHDQPDHIRDLAMFNSNSHYVVWKHMGFLLCKIMSVSLLRYGTEPRPGSWTAQALPNGKKMRPVATKQWSGPGYYLPTVPPRLRKKPLAWMGWDGTTGWTKVGMRKNGGRPGWE